MMIVEEPLFRVHGLWLLYALFAVPVLIGPSMNSLTVVLGGGLFVSWLQRRRQRASLAVRDGEIVIVNRYSTHHVPVKGAVIGIRTESVWSHTGSSELDAAVAATKVMFVLPPESGSEKIHVDAMRGLIPRKFRSVAMKFRAALAMG